MRVRVATSTLVFRKLLRLKAAAFRRASEGRILNLLSNDVGAFELGFLYLNHLWVGGTDAAMQARTHATEARVADEEKILRFIRETQK